MFTTSMAELLLRNGVNSQLRPGRLFTTSGWFTRLFCENHSVLPLNLAAPYTYDCKKGKIVAVCVPPPYSGLNFPASYTEGIFCAKLLIWNWKVSTEQLREMGKGGNFSPDISSLQFSSLELQSCQCSSAQCWFVKSVSLKEVTWPTISQYILLFVLLFCVSAYFPWHLADLMFLIDSFFLSLIAIKAVFLFFSYHVPAQSYTELCSIEDSSTCLDPLCTSPCIGSHSCIETQRQQQNLLCQPHFSPVTTADFKWKFKW